MSERLNLENLLEKIRKIENFEVLGYEGNDIVISNVKGIVRMSLDDEVKKTLSELKRRRPRGKPTDKQLKTIEEVVKILVSNKLKFKIIFGPKEVIVRFDLDHYIRLTDRDVRIVGFRDENDDILRLISGVLLRYGPLVFLKRL
ncbi:MAG: hypothetical protein B6V02_00830 [Thermoprotei archaeon ex4572_64]|nr:MAG: hypothetical protein B6V02_00830 [Thermoprotei archaeon ex4572_64]